MMSLVLLVETFLPIVEKPVMVCNVKDGFNKEVGEDRKRKGRNQGGGR